MKKQRKLEKNFIKKKAVYNYLKEKEQEDSLTNREKNVLKNIDRYLKKFKKDYKNINIWFRLFIQ